MQVKSIADLVSMALDTTLWMDPRPGFIPLSLRMRRQRGRLERAQARERMIRVTQLRQRVVVIPTASGRSVQVPANPAKSA